MKIIFLDLDGVLNSENYFHNDFLDYSEDIIDKSYPKLHFDYNSAKIINEIIQITDAKVVLSSTWRKGRDLQTCKDLLNYIGVKCELIDVTPYFEYQPISVPRGMEINYWLEYTSKRNDIEVESYLILDDDIDMLYNHRNNFIHIDYSTGLTKEHINRCVQILEKKSKFYITKK